MYRIDSRSAVPVYEQLRRQIVLDIVSGKLENGMKLSSIRVMATSLKINPNTVARVYRQLETDGFVESKKGLGVFIRIEEEKLDSDRYGIFRDLTEDYIFRAASIGITSDEIMEHLTRLLREGVENDKID